MVKVPDHIPKPDYADNGIPTGEMALKEYEEIIICDKDTIERLRECGVIARKAIDVGHRMVAVGVTTDAINNAVHDFIIESGGYPSPLNYHGFPKSICTSVNEAICHGIPDDRPL